MTAEEMTQLAINTIRRLSIDAVQAAKSGHPATPMALAPLIYTIWNRVMRFDPEDPIWPKPRSFRPVEWPRFHAASVSTPSNKGGERQLRKPRAGVGISLSMPSGTSSNIRRRNIGIASCRRTSKCVLRWSRRRASDGSDTSAGRARSRNENVWRIGTTERTPEKVRLRA